MLTIVIPDSEFFNSETNEFYTIKGQKLILEHSLLSVSKWEAKWHKPFIGSPYKKEEKTLEETIDYIRCMTVSPSNVDQMVYNSLTTENLRAIENYMNDSMTATWFNDKNKSGGKSRETITSELIYYWMIALEIPFSCEKWHLNRLLALIEVCNRKNGPTKKMSKRDIARQNSSINAARRAAMHSRG